MKVAAAQISCTVGDVNANMRKIRDFCAMASRRGVELILFPEMVDTGYVMRVISERASPWTDGAVPELQAIANAHSLAIVCGVSERVGGSIYNAEVAIDSSGAVVAKYRKTHLFSPAPIEEHKCFEAGTELGVYTLGPMRFGLSICYDLRFPELYRSLAISGGANAFLISSAWPFPRVEHLRTLSVARAIENQSYIIVANRVGTDNGVTFCGNSVIIDPYGVVLASASADEEELIEAEISESEVEAVRTRMPVLTHCRPEVYKQAFVTDPSA